MNALLIFFIYFIFQFSLTIGFTFFTGISHSRSTRLYNFLAEWTNPNYPIGDIWELWKKNDHLITIGKEGLKPSHVSSFKQLIIAHEYLKVKILSERNNATEVCNRILQECGLSFNEKIITLRKNGFLIKGQKVKVPVLLKEAISTDTIPTGSISSDSTSS